MPERFYLDSPPSGSTGMAEMHWGIERDEAGMPVRMYWSSQRQAACERSEARQRAEREELASRNGLKPMCPEWASWLSAHEKGASEG